MICPKINCRRDPLLCSISSHLSFRDLWKKYFAKALHQSSPLSKYMWARLLHPDKEEPAMIAIVIVIVIAFVFVILIVTIFMILIVTVNLFVIVLVLVLAIVFVFIYVCGTSNYKSTTPNICHKAVRKLPSPQDADSGQQVMSHHHPQLPRLLPSVPTHEDCQRKARHALLLFSFSSAHGPQLLNDW